MSPKQSPWDDEPKVATDSGPSSRERVIRGLFFAINFLVSLAMCLQMVVYLATVFDPMKLRWDPNLLLGVLAMLLFAGPFAFDAWAEWRAYYHADRLMERELGNFNLVCAAIALLAVIANVGQALVNGDRSLSLLWLSLGGLAIATYWFVCGVSRRRKPKPDASAAAASS